MCEGPLLYRSLTKLSYVIQQFKFDVVRGLTTGILISVMSAQPNDHDYHQSPAELAALWRAKPDYFRLESARIGAIHRGRVA